MVTLNVKILKKESNFSYIFVEILQICMLSRGEQCVYPRAIVILFRENDAKAFST